MVDFDPAVGDEIQKLRPAVVISSDGVARLKLRIVAPITGWKPAFQANYWHVQVPADAHTHLEKLSAVDAFQVRSIAIERFIRLRGHLSAALMDEIACAVALLIEVPPL